MAPLIAHWGQYQGLGLFSERSYLASRANGQVRGDARVCLTGVGRNGGLLPLIQSYVCPYMAHLF
jgi:hypothetical protein